MKGMLKKFVALTAIALFWSSQANAVLIEIVPATVGPAGIGDIVSIDIVASDLGADVITAYDILIEFDAALLAANTVFFGSGLGGFDFLSLQGAFAAAGQVDVSELSFVSDGDLSFFGYQDGNPFTLFTLDFVALQDFNTTDFSFVWDQVHSVTCGGNQVCFPTAVPEPGTLALLGLGLLGMTASRRRKLAR